jgi:hypothetical protein
MPVRTRQRLGYNGGYRQHNKTHIVDSASYTSLDQWCQDIDDAGDNQPFTVRSYERSGGQIFGQQSNPLIGYNWQGIPATYFLSDSFASSALTIPGQPTDGELAIKLLRRTNPSRASSQAVSNLLEMKDVLPLLRDDTKEVVDKISRKLRGFFPKVPGLSIIDKWARLDKFAKATIISYFAVQPILADIETICQFQSLVAKRVKEIERLRGDKGLRRTVDLWGGSASFLDVSRLIQSQGVTLRADISKVTERTIRGHVRWHASSNWLHDDPTVRAVARRVVNGFYLDHTSLYEAMPWSWLIDWFSNLGDFVSATRNVLDATHSLSALSVHTRTITKSINGTTSGTAPNIISCTPWLCVTDEKIRRYATPTLVAQFGFLDENQLSILGSLSYLKARRALK